MGQATIKTTYLQSPMFETTPLEKLSLDPFFNFTFYCDSSYGTVTLNPKIPSLSGSASNTTYNVKTYLQAGTDKPDYGCQSITQNSYTAICCSTPITNNVLVSPIVFIVAVLTLLGWAVFSVFCGVGMASLPYDWLNEFKHRPRPITSAQYDYLKVLV